nr:hypothetical protein [uncultured Clostridium sp.]
MKNFIFPKGTMILTEEEQEKRICGVAHIEMNPLYLAKSACEVKAAQLIATKQVTQMSVLGIAQEIFAHACAYYASGTIIALGVDSSKVKGNALCHISDLIFTKFHILSYKKQTL